jgi:predicted N-acyltransferase
VLAQGLRDVAEETDASSIHVLFCREEELAELGTGRLRCPRASYQFHWTNRREEPPSFDDYLGTFRSRMRKQVRHERAVVADYGLRIETMFGSELDDRGWQALDRFYRSTVDRYGNVASLTPAFFAEIRRTHADRLLAVLAYRGDEPIAATTNFTRGIGFAAATGEARSTCPCCTSSCASTADRTRHRPSPGHLRGRRRRRAEAGARPLPQRTFSAHWIRHRGLAHAVGDYIAREAMAVEAEMRACLEHSPFARECRSL